MPCALEMELKSIQSKFNPHTIEIDFAGKRYRFKMVFYVRLLSNKRAWSDHFEREKALGIGILTLPESINEIETVFVDSLGNPI